MEDIRENGRILSESLQQIRGCLRKRKKAYAKLTIEESYYPKRYPESKRPRQVNISHQCDNLSHSKLMDLRG